MAERNITYLLETNLITCVLQTGLAEEVLEAATNCGAQGATISYARGTGIRERMGLMGVVIDEQKEIVRGNQAAAQFYGLVSAAVIIGVSIVVAAAVLGGLQSGAGLLSPPTDAWRQFLDVNASK